MSIYIPYFYIIRHIESGKMYAGSRWKINCNPEELLKENGYHTSSESIKKIILEEGLNSFEILRIDTYCDNLHPYDYEKLFLEINNCANSDNWFNIHNNTGITTGTKNFKQLIKKKYGENIENVFQVESVKEKIKETCLERYGVENVSCSDEIKERKFNTMAKTFGTLENAFKHVKEKRTETIKEKYGDEFENSFQVPEIKEKIKETNIEKYGVDSWAKSSEGKKFHSEKFKKMWAEFPILVCPHCGKESKSKTNMKKYHFDNCKKK